MNTRDSIPSAESLPSDVLHSKAITIQKNYRGYRDRKYYTFIESDKDNDQFYGFNGNDPEIDLADCHLPYPTENFALIGNSTLRSVEIACELGLPNHDKFTPKVFIVDFSDAVMAFWIELKRFFTDYTTQAEAIAHLDDLIQAVGERIGRYYRPSQTELKSLLEKYSFNTVAKIVLHAQVIKQDWQDTNTFISIRHILERLGMKNTVVYASNIAVCNDNFYLMTLENIRILNPAFSIHTNRVPVKGAHPDQFFIFDNNIDSLTMGRQLFHNQKPRLNPQETLNDAILQLNQFLQPYCLHIDKKNPSLLLSLLFSLIGASGAVRFAVNASYFYYDLIFSFSCSPDIAKMMVDKLNKFDPKLRAASNLIPNDDDSRLPFSSVVSVALEPFLLIIKKGFPHLWKVDPIYKGSCNKQLVELRNTLFKPVAECFQKYDLDIFSSHALVYAMCLAAIQKRKPALMKLLAEYDWSCIEMMIYPNDVLDDTVKIVFALSQPLMKVLLDWFNSIEANSAVVTGQEAILGEDTFSVSMQIKKSIILNPEFSESVENAIAHFDPHYLELMWKKANKLSLIADDIASKIAKTFCDDGLSDELSRGSKSMKKLRVGIASFIVWMNRNPADKLGMCLYGDIKVGLVEAIKSLGHKSNAFFKSNKMAGSLAFLQAYFDEIQNPLMAVHNQHKTFQSVLQARTSSQHQSRVSLSALPK